MNQIKPRGFTLIELMLAMTFISALLIAIAMTTIQISNIYTKGITLREVNQAGRALSDDLLRGVAAAEPFDAAKWTTNNHTKFVSEANGGRLCLGKYTYAWNYGNAVDIGNSATFNNYSNDTAVIRLVKVADANGELCGNNPGQTNINKNNATDMLAEGDRDLVIHKFSIQRTKDDPVSGQALYAISFTIGTNDREQLTTNDASCRPPSDNVGDEAYCSVNQFDIIARSGNQSGE
jgi:type II secretory pathway pseudopilin PulG